MLRKNRLSAAELRCDCPPSVFSFKHTGEIEPLSDVIGQQRAVQAIEFGLNMDSPGYNIFVTGIEGTGKNTIVKDLVTKFARDLPTPMDWCLVNNFNDSYRPIPLAVPSGKAVRFSRSVQKVIDDVAVKLQKEFESKTYTDKLKEITDGFTQYKTTVMSRLDATAGRKGLVITKSAAGYQPVPVVDGKPMTEAFFQALSPEKKAGIEAALQDFSSEIESAMAEIRKTGQEQ